ncbi:MAG: precorrin-8X methylmutase [Pseudomonadota bacterium]
MPLFDRYVIVDWSAANAPKTGKDSIWIAEADREGSLSVTNIATRRQAMQVVHATCCGMAAGERAFFGFDFGFGYPSGAARMISGSARWDTLWQSIEILVADNENNISNRFEVGADLNSRCFSGMEGPFWGHPHQHVGRYPGLGPRRPNLGGHIAENRIVETRVPKAQPVWKLAYAGSVGSQTLLGIKHLEQVRIAFPDVVSIWPFETRFAEDLTKPVIIAEVYPSLFPVMEWAGETKDAAQVRTVATMFADLDSDNALEPLLARPPSLDDNEAECVLNEEGWIVGAGMDQKWLDKLSHVRDPAEIYRQSFEIVRREARIDELPEGMRDVAIRLVHSCGMTDIVEDLAFSEDAAKSGKAALMAGKPIYTDVEMVRSGIIERLLPRGNAVICTLNDNRVPQHAREIGNTRSAAAVDFWEQMEGAIVVVGNAPTALFRVLEQVKNGGAKPALIIGIPVGFVGAVESKEALATNPLGLEYISVLGRRGGSAMASGVLNALAGGLG